MILTRNPSLNRAVYFVGLVVASFLSYSLTVGAHVQVSAEKTSCGNFTEVTGYFSGDDVTKEVYCNGGDNVSAGTFSSADTDKATFISDAESSPAEAFYVSLMLGSNKDRPATADDIAAWVNKIENPDISIKVSKQSKDYRNSLYLSDKNDYAFYNVKNPVGVSSLVFYNNKTNAVYTIIKIDCGNPLNGLALPASGSVGGNPTPPSPPPPPPDSPPGGTLTSVCNSTTATIAMDATDPDSTAQGHGTPGYIVVAGHTLGTFTGSHTYNVMSYAAWGSVAVSFYAKDIGPGSDGNYHDIKNTSIGSCATITCGTTNLTGTLGLKVNRFFHVTMHYSIPSPVPPSSNFTIKVTGTAIPGGKTYGPATALLQVSQTITSRTYVFQPTATGTYAVTWTYGSIPCPSGGPVVGNVTSLPYISVRGGDVAAGPGFCGLSGSVPDATAGIQTSNTDNVDGLGDYNGAGAQLAALALADINSFPTGQADGTTSSLGGSFNPSALAFANTGSVTPVYGGKYFTGSYAPGTNYWCVPDSVGTIGADTSPSVPPASDYSAAATYTSTSYVYNGNLNLPGVTVNSNRNITLKVKGDVYISGNIGYSYSSRATIPRFNLYVEGNIYIGSGVTNLSGFYVAEPDSTNPNTGKIYTCAMGDDMPINGSVTGAIYNTCNTPLMVDGAMSAKTFVLNRSYGSVVGSGSIPGGPAETFQSSPELWLTGLDESDDAGSGLQVGQWQAVTSLPPVL